MFDNRPILKIKKDKIDRYVNICNVIIIVFTFIYPAICYSDLPEYIPAHYNFNGEVNRYDEKSWIWFLPILSLGLNVGLYYLIKIPHTFNYLVKITPQNAEDNYKKGSKMMRFTALVISILFLVITYQTVTLALNGLQKTPVWSEYLIYFLLFILTFGTLTYALWESFKRKK